MPASRSPSRRARTGGQIGYAPRTRRTRNIPSPHVARTPARYRVSRRRSRRSSFPVAARHDAPAVEFRGHRRVLQQADAADRVLRRVGHSAPDARPVRRGVPVRVDPQEVGPAQQPDGGGQELQLARVAGGRRHGGQEARHAPARRQLRVQVREQAEDRLSGGHAGECLT